MNVLIVAEHHEGALRKATLNALTAGQSLAQKTGGELHVLLVGSGVGAVADELKGYGGEAVVAVAKSTGAVWVGAAATAMGKDLLPRVAARLGAGMVSDILGFEGNGAAVTVKRPMWAGNVIAQVEVRTPVKVFTVRATEFPAAQKASAPAPVVAETVAAPSAKVKFVEFKAVKSARPELTEARVVVAGGRGTKGNFKPVEDLADELHGAVGASRAACDAGWIANDYQVGQTGKVVAPELYVAAGISGAIQHLAGMKGSKVIVAVNTNNEAPIFQVADYGLVADLHKALPELTAAIKASR
jgi:electron transfer flavoprotein alpha subunit